MALIDEATITVKAGDGGNGNKTFITTFGRSKTAPDGGDGGRGGNVYFQASHNMSDLGQFRFQKDLAADNGANGKHKNLTGHAGKDLLVIVPPGTTLTDLETNETVEIIDEGAPILVAKGGRGGHGNHDYHPTRNNYHLHSDGEAGEFKKFHVMLNLIAQIGLIGYPNAGKSSLLKALTNATPKIGNYAFTTLEPNLGAMGSIIIADIPGLIEGASKGKGLGINFLKHIEKTHILAHCLDSSQAELSGTYRALRDELAAHDKKLLEKKEIIVLTKTDLLSKDELREKTVSLQKLKRDIVPVSIHDPKSLKKLRELFASTQSV